MKKFFKLTLAALALAFCATTSTNALFAQDEAQAKPEKNPAIFDVPEDKDVDFYVDLLPKLMQEYSAEASDASSQDEIKEINGKLGAALKTVFLKTNGSEDEKVQEVNANAFVVAVQVYGSLGDLDTVKSLRENVKNDELAKALDPFIFQLTVRAAIASEDKDKINAVIEDFFAKADQPAYAQSADAVAAGLQQYDAELAKAFSNRVVETFKEGTDLQKRIAESFVGKVRFNELVGNEMKVEGLYLDGKEIDWESYRGKVVLVDFWATWCGPCLGEIPNVQALYEKYREAGFDVLGYSVDRDVDALKKFEEERKLPWKTASETLSVQAKDAGGKEYVSLSAYYGVNAIPTMVLVGKDGKVLDTHARGERLKELLEGQFPDVK